MAKGSTRSRSTSLNAATTVTKDVTWRLSTQERSLLGSSMKVYATLLTTTLRTTIMLTARLNMLRSFIASAILKM